MESELPAKPLPGEQIFPPVNPEGPGYSSLFPKRIGTSLSPSHLILEDFCFPLQVFETYLSFSADGLLPRGVSPPPPPEISLKSGVEPGDYPLKLYNNMILNFPDSKIFSS